VYLLFISYIADAIFIFVIVVGFTGCVVVVVILIMTTKKNFNYSGKKID
jgi:hypothetical protein